MPAIQSICVVRLSALGDVLMCVPLIRALQAAMPHARLTWVISNPAYALVKGMEGVEFIVIDKPKGLMDYGRFLYQMWPRRFDVLIAAQASFRANLLYACIRAPRKIGYDSLRAKDGHAWFVHERITPGRDHTLDGFLKFAHKLGIPTTKAHWDLPIAAEDAAWADAQLTQIDKPVLIVNPAASKPERTWDLARYIEVIRYVMAHELAAVVLTGGPSAVDARLGEAIAQAVPGVVNLIGKTCPNQLLALIKAADLVLCPDTGPSHMAAAVGTPVIALHAVTHAAVSGPYTCLDLCINAYPQAVQQVLGQTEATCVWGTHVHGFEAMQLIQVDDVIARVEAVLTNRWSSL